MFLYYQPIIIFLKLKWYFSFYCSKLWDSPQAIALLESESIVRSSFSFTHACCHDISGAKTIDINYVWFESLILTDATNKPLMDPSSSLSTPYMSAFLDFPFTVPSTFHFSMLGGGKHQFVVDLLTFICFHIRTNSNWFATNPRLKGQFWFHPLSQKPSLNLIKYRGLGQFAFTFSYTTHFLWNHIDQIITKKKEIHNFRWNSPSLTASTHLSNSSLLQQQ